MADRAGGHQERERLGEVQASRDNDAHKMTTVLHTINQLIEAIGTTYQAIDIRSVAIRKEDSWVNVMAVVRLTYEDVDAARTRLTKIAQRFSPVKTDLLRIDSFVRPFLEWSDLCSELKNGILKMGDQLEFQLRQKPDLLEANGYIQWGYSRLRPFDGRVWPGLTKTFEVDGMSPLFEGRLSREAHLIGYGDVLEAANALCELNVSQQDLGCDLSISLPVFANVCKIQIRTPEKRIDVEVQRHHNFSDLRAVVCVRGRTVLADAPFREQMPLSSFPSDGKAEIVSAHGSVQIQDLDPDNDWLELRLVHPKLGEVKKDANYVRMCIPPSERNILLEAVQYFCRGAKLHDLLVRAYNEQAKKLKPSAAFELHVSWLLSMFGLSPVVLGEYEHIFAPDTEVQRASVDILAASQDKRLLLIVGCTLNPAKPEDFSNLRYAREILARDVFAGTAVTIIPISFTSSMGGPQYDRPEDHFDSVPIVDADSMKHLLEHLRTGQEGRFFQFLSNPTYGLTVYSQPH